MRKSDIKLNRFNLSKNDSIYYLFHSFFSSFYIFEIIYINLFSSFCGTSVGLFSIKFERTFALPIFSFFDLFPITIILCRSLKFFPANIFLLQ